MKPLTKKQYKTIRNWIKRTIDDFVPIEVTKENGKVETFSVPINYKFLEQFENNFKPKPKPVGEKMEEMKKRSIAEMERRENEAAKIAIEIIKDSFKNILKNLPDDEVPPDNLKFSCI